MEITSRVARVDDADYDVNSNDNSIDAAAVYFTKTETMKWISYSINIY